MFNVHSLKVDCTALTNERHGNFRNDTGGERQQQYLLVENINIPVAIVYSPVEYTLALERTRTFLVEEYTNETVLLPVYFQVTATYNLVHKVTGATRVWTGSFFPHGNTPSSLTPFTRFDPDTFVNFVQRHTSRQRIEDTLKNVKVDSQWEFESLVSIIVNAQANVLSSHPVLINRNLLHHGRRKRVHRTFGLP